MPRMTLADWAISLAILAGFVILLDCIIQALFRL
jgi:hypothetical protein